MSGWLFFIDLVRSLVFAAAHLCGNSLGGGILAVSVMVRLALLPLTLRVARRSIAHQRQIAAIAPELAQLKKKYGRDTVQLTEATGALYQKHGIAMLPRGTFTAALIQLPIGSAIYKALGSGWGARSGFLWMTDITRPDAIVATSAAVLAGVAASVVPGTSHRSAVAISTLVTLLFAWRLSATIGLYWLASNAIGVVQSLLLRRSAPA